MSMAPNYLVEVRDRDFIRIGQLSQEFMNLKFTEVFRGIGTWELKLPAEHPLLNALKEKGSGIVITETWPGGSRVYSGRTRSCVLDQNSEDVNGTWTISGADDGLIAAATVVYPDPANAHDKQLTAYWNLSGNGETVMKQAVLLNAGASAIPARQYDWLSVPTNLNRGGNASANARFDVLGDLLQALAEQSGLGWSFYQVGDGIVFDVTVPADLTSLIRLDVRTGGLDSSQLGYTAPDATEVLVLGQGEGAARTVLQVSSVESAAEAALWGVRWESTKDQRNTNDPTELAEAGSEIINERGTTINSLKVEPSDAPGQKLGRDWYLGDTVTVVVDGQETQAIVAQIATSISSAGVIKQATVGDPVGFNWDARVGSAIKKQGQRIDRLENYIDPRKVETTFPVAINRPQAISYNRNAISDLFEELTVDVRNGFASISGLVALATVTSGTVIATLPAGARPDTDMMFVVDNSGIGRAMNIKANGEITLNTTFTTNGYLSLSGIIYPVAGRAQWTNFVSGDFRNGWVDYYVPVTTEHFGRARYWKDEFGVVWRAGLIKSGTVTANTQMLELPSGAAGQSRIQHVPVPSQNLFSHLRINGTALRIGTGGNTAWVSLAGLHQSQDSHDNLPWVVGNTDFVIGNAWTNYDAAIYPTLGYVQRADGVCMTRGLIRNGTLTGVITFLPDSMRRFRTNIIITVSADALGRIDVNGSHRGTTGGLVATSGSTTWFSFDGRAWMPEEFIT